MVITNEMIKEAVGIDLKKPVEFKNLALINSNLSDVLSFVDHEKYISQLTRNKNVRGVFITLLLAKKMANIPVEKIICDDPRFYFFSLYNYCANKNYKQKPSTIHTSASIHPKAYVSDYNVLIGANVVVGPNVSILPDVEIGNDCLVRAGTVLGCDDAEIKCTSHGIFRVIHDGKLIIGERVEIGANCTIDKGFSFQNTVIGDETKIANTTYIGHSVKIGKQCLLFGCTISGSTIVQDNVRINPGAIITNQVIIGKGAEVSLGAVVVQSVTPNEKVSGNFAMEHKKFMYNYAKIFGPF